MLPHYSNSLHGRSHEVLNVLLGFAIQHAHNVELTGRINVDVCSLERKPVHCVGNALTSIENGHNSYLTVDIFVTHL